ncbi:MAG: alpha-mannosidase, partial [Planctomycetota bacterium]
HRQSHVHPEALHCIGYGDGGGGPTAEMCERVRRLGDLQGMPASRWGTIEGFFERLESKKALLPTWQGEMYLEYHRGVQTTHGNLKAAFRGLERGLQIHEAVRCVTGGGPVGDHAWKRLVFSQFHDYIPGSSIQRVYDEGVPELESLGEGAVSAAADELSVGGDSTAGP